MITAEESLKGLSGIDEFMVLCSDAAGFPEFCRRTMNLNITAFQMEWVHAFIDNYRSLIEAPRQHGKTTILAQAYPIWRCFFSTGYDFLVVSHRMEHSTKILTAIKQFIHNSELLQKRLVPKATSRMTWRKTMIQTKTGCSISTNPNTHAVCGGTYDDVLCDEISLYNDYDVYFKDIIPTVGTRKGHIMAIGTPKTGIDLLAKIKEINDQKGGYFYRKYQAFMSEGNPLWPEMYDSKEWAKIKQSMSSLDFQREYMCEIVDAKTQILPPSIVVSCYDPNQFFEKTPSPGFRYYAGSDLSRSPDGDFNVHTVVRVDSQGFVTISHIERMKGMDVDSRALQMSNLYKNYKPLRYLADESLDGKAVIDEILKTYHIPVEGFVFTPDNRYAAITNLIKLFERNKIRIPSREGDFYTAEVVQKLTKEMSDMVRDITPAGQPTYKSIGKHDDMVMSLALACYPINEGAATTGLGDYIISGSGAVQGDVKVDLRHSTPSYFI